ncbi:MAG: hypothetical protein ABJM82_06095 [Shimia thalassica]|uniref:hypothetical protein n=1 Tax=Rhodobacterales TaxID=204455 RepID=UPI0032978C7D
MATSTLYWRFFGAALFFALLSPVWVQAEPFCDAHEQAAPDGVVVELGGLHFRICDKRFRMGGDERGTDPVFFMPGNTAPVRRVLERYTDLGNVHLSAQLKVTDMDFEYPSINNYNTSDTYVGDVILAGARYKAYYSHPFSEAEKLLFEKGNMSTNKYNNASFPLLVYAPTGKAELKPHILNCSGDFLEPSQGSFRCYLKMNFDEKRSLVAQARISWSPSNVFEPLDFDNLDIFLNALTEVFESIKVDAPGDL